MFECKFARTNVGHYYSILVYINFSSEHNSMSSFKEAMIYKVID